MTTMLFGSHSAASVRRPSFGLSLLVSKIGQEISLWRATRAMEGLDDHMLQDMGINRGEVEIAVRSGRDGLSR